MVSLPAEYRRTFLEANKRSAHIYLQRTVTLRLRRSLSPSSSSSLMWMRCSRNLSGRQAPGISEPESQHGCKCCTRSSERRRQRWFIRQYFGGARRQSSAMRQISKRGFVQGESIGQIGMRWVRSLGARLVTEGEVGSAASWEAGARANTRAVAAVPMRRAPRSIFQDHR